MRRDPQPLTGAGRAPGRARFGGALVLPAALLALLPPGRGSAPKRAVVVGPPRRGRFIVTVRLRLSGDRRQTAAQRRCQRCP